MKNNINNINNNKSHALRQKEYPKTKHFHHWCIKMSKRGFFILDNLLFLKGKSFKIKEYVSRVALFCFIASRRMALNVKQQEIPKTKNSPCLRVEE